MQQVHLLDYLKSAGRVYFKLYEEIRKDKYWADFKSGFFSSFCSFFAIFAVGLFATWAIDFDWPKLFHRFL